MKVKSAKFYIKIVLSFFLALPSPAMAISWYSFNPNGSEITSTNGEPLSLGEYFDANGNRVSLEKMPFESIICLPDGREIYAMKKNYPGVSYGVPTRIADVEVSKDGKTLKSDILGDKLSLDSAAPARGTKLRPDYLPTGRNANSGNGTGGGNGSSVGGGNGSSNSSGLGNQFSQSIQKSFSAGIVAGVYTGAVTAAFRGALLSAGTAENVVRVRAQLSATNKQIGETYKLTNQQIEGAYKLAAKNLDPSKFSTSPIDWDRASRGVKTTTEPYRGLVIENRIILNSIVTFRARDQQAKDLGLKMNELSDDYFSVGNIEGGSAILKYATAFADLAVGLDPISGTIRDTYESLSGLNLITGEPLDNVSRTFAVVGMVTFGFGSKLHAGIKLLQESKLANRLTRPIQNFIFEKAAKIANGRFLHLSRDYRRAYANETEVVSKVFAERPEKLGEITQVVNTTTNFVQNIGVEGVRARRIVPGAGDRVVVIGRNMGIANKSGVIEPGVIQLTERLQKAGMNAEHFVLPKHLESELEKIGRIEGRKILRPHEVEKTMTYQLNKDYLEGAIKDGATIIDLGNPHNKPYSHFYDYLEQSIMDRTYGKL